MEKFISREQGAKIRNGLQDSEMVVVMDVEQIIEATIARFQEVIKADYSGMVAPFANLRPVELEEPEIFKAVDDVRKRLKADRNAIERLRKQLKEDSLRTGKAIDQKAKELTEPILAPEMMLETLIEDFKSYKAQKEREEAEALSRIVNERVSALLAFGVKISHDDAMRISQDAYIDLLESAKTDFQLKEAQRLADEQRAKEEAERVRLQAIEQEERAQELARKEADIAKKMQVLDMMYAQRMTPDGVAVVVADDVPEALANETLGFRGITWQYKSDQVAPTMPDPVEEMPATPSNGSGDLALRPKEFWYNYQPEPTESMTEAQQGGMALHDEMVAMADAAKIEKFIKQVRGVPMPLVTNPAHVAWLDNFYKALWAAI